MQSSLQAAHGRLVTLQLLRISARTVAYLRREIQIAPAKIEGGTPHRAESASAHAYDVKITPHCYNCPLPTARYLTLVPDGGVRPCSFSPPGVADPGRGGGNSYYTFAAAPGPMPDGGVGTQRGTPAAAGRTKPNSWIIQWPAIRHALSPPKATAKNCASALSKSEEPDSWNRERGSCTSRHGNARGCPWAGTAMAARRFSRRSSAIAPINSK